MLPPCYSVEGINVTLDFFFPLAMALSYSSLLPRTKIAYLNNLLFSV